MIVTPSLQRVAHIVGIGWWRFAGAQYRFVIGIPPGLIQNNRHLGAIRNHLGQRFCFLVHLVFALDAELVTWGQNDRSLFIEGLVNNLQGFRCLELFGKSAIEFLCFVVSVGLESNQETKE